MNAQNNITNVGNNIIVFSGTELVPESVPSVDAIIVNIIPDYDKECSICLTDMHADSKNVYEIPCCKKRFHRTCLLRWYDYTQETQCPLCKQDVDIAKIIEPPPLSIYQKIRNFICHCETRC